MAVLQIMKIEEVKQDNGPFTIKVRRITILGQSQLRKFVTRDISKRFGRSHWPKNVVRCLIVSRRTDINRF